MIDVIFHPQNHPVGQAAHAIARVAICCIFLFMLFGCATHPGVPRSEPDSPSPAAQMIRFYQGPLNHLTAVRYGGCPMHPGCSAYSMAAIRAHGLLMGWIMACDRLIRCGGDETRLSPEVLAEGQWKCQDSLDRNDFWWHPQPADTGSNDADIPPSSTRWAEGWGISIQ